MSYICIPYIQNIDTVEVLIKKMTSRPVKERVRIKCGAVVDVCGHPRYRLDKGVWIKTPNGLVVTVPHQYTRPHGTPKGKVKESRIDFVAQSSRNVQVEGSPGALGENVEMTPISPMPADIGANMLFFGGKRITAYPPGPLRAGPNNINLKLTAQITTKVVAKAVMLKVER